MRIATIVGARPQFIKAVVVSRVLRKKFKEILIHTGQHYGDEMSGVFFRELKLPNPDYWLELGKGHPGVQVGAMLSRLIEVLLKTKPDLVLVYGDTHSTLAGALAAAKLDIPLAHVEAGLRSYHPTMQEEKNRVVTDHLSQILFCPTKTAVLNLKKEGITRGVHQVGDVMVDALNHFLPLAESRSRILRTLHLSPKTYYLATIHRAENADNKKRFGSILKAFADLNCTIVLPLHPRTRREMARHRLRFPKNVNVIMPLGYLDMLWLEKNAQVILTDSGGVQKEAYLLQVPCVTLREETEWPETTKRGWNKVSGVNPNKITNAVRQFFAKTPTRFKGNEFGVGNTAQKIAALLRVS